MKGICGWFPVPLHGFSSGRGVTAIRSWTQADKGRQTVTHCNPIGPKSSSAAVPICKWMNSHPFGMGPGAEVNDCTQLISCQRLAGRPHFIEQSHRLLQLCLKPCQFLRNPVSRCTIVKSDSYLDTFQPRFTAK